MIEVGGGMRQSLNARESVRGAKWKRAQSLVDNLRPGEEISATTMAEAIGVSKSSAIRYLHRCARMNLVVPAGRTRHGLHFVRGHGGRTKQ